MAIASRVEVAFEAQPLWSRQSTQQDAERGRPSAWANLQSAGPHCTFPSHLSSFSSETEITMNKIRQEDYPGNYVLCPLSFFVPPAQAGVRSRLSLLRELGRSFHPTVLGNPNHRNLASTIRRRALPRRRPPRDGKDRTGLIDRFALLLNFNYRRQPHAEDSADRISGQRAGNEEYRRWHSHHHLHHRQHRTLEEQC